MATWLDDMSSYLINTGMELKYILGINLFSSGFFKRNKIKLLNKTKSGWKLQMIYLDNKKIK